mgnify:FL=1
MTHNRTYEICHNRADDLRDDLQRGLRAFYARHECLPAAVVVSPGTVDEARRALQSLDLPDLAVEVTGGCLAGEVWLATAEEVSV